MVANIVDTGEYKETAMRIAALRARLEMAGRAEIPGIGKEIGLLFGELRLRRPWLYAAFEVEGKALGMEMAKKLGGRRAIID
jgi:hypothetical protein